MSALKLPVWAWHDSAGILFMKYYVSHLFSHNTKLYIGKSQTVADIK